MRNLPFLGRGARALGIAPRVLMVLCFAPWLACGEVKQHAGEGDAGGHGGSARGGAGGGFHPAGSGGAAGGQAGSGPGGAPGAGGGDAGNPGLAGSGGIWSGGSGGAVAGAGGAGGPAASAGSGGAGGPAAGSGGAGHGGTAGLGTAGGPAGRGGAIAGAGGGVAGAGVAGGGVAGGGVAGGGVAGGGIAGGGVAGGGVAGGGVAGGAAGSPAGRGGGVAGSGGAAAGTGGAAAGSGGSAAGTGGTGGEQPNVIFVTSKTFTLTELAAKAAGTGAAAVLRGADKACAEAVAASGSLAPAGTYVAWISSRSQSALGRLMTARGGTMPRGWKRVDGLPVIDQLTTGSQHVLYPVGVTELGQSPAHVWVWTATDASTTHNETFDCQDWTSVASTDYGVVGLPSAGGANWTGGVAGACNNSLPLYCMQVDHTLPVTVIEVKGAKRAFMSASFTPTSGIAGADTLCAKDAQHFGLTGTFRALLAQTNVSPASRFHPTNSRPYVRLDGVVVASVDSDLFQATPKMLAPINVDAYGNTSGGVAYVGAPNLVTAAGSTTCSDWSSSAETTTYGTVNYTGTNAFYGFSDSCTRGGVVYCLED
jgi:hypothetical protein